MHQKQTSFKDYSTLHIETMYTFCYKRVVISKIVLFLYLKKFSKWNEKLLYNGNIIFSGSNSYLEKEMWFAIALKSNTILFTVLRSPRELQIYILPFSNKKISFSQHEFQNRSNLKSHSQAKDLFNCVIICNMIIISNRFIENIFVNLFLTNYTFQLFHKYKNRYRENTCVGCFIKRKN